MGRWPVEWNGIMNAGNRFSNRIVRAPHGTELSAKSWQSEAPMRMLMNNLDPEVAELPHELIVYGGMGRAARDWECYDKIVEVLERLETDETLLVQSGKPVGVFRTHPDAPRVLIANSNLVPRWATWEHFNELDRKGLMMYGQMTAGSWIYIGSQGIIQGTYETFVSAARTHYDGELAGRWVLTAGLGGMGARSRSPRPWRAPRCSRWSATRDGSASVSIPATSIACRPISMRRWGSSSNPVPSAHRSRSRCWATPPKSIRSWCAAARARTSSPTRPAPMIR